MPVAISIKAVNGTAGPIRELWEQVGRFERRPSMAALGHPPHVTLAVYADLARDRLRSVVETAFAGRHALRIVFDGIRHFDGPPLVLWAAPSDSDTLHRAHAEVHRLVDPTLCHPHYRPGAWAPHCTLGTEVLESRRDDALAFARRAIAPFAVVFDAADGVAFPPVEVIAECALAPAADGPTR